MYQIDRALIKDFFNGAGKDIYSICENTVMEFSMTELIEGGVLVGFSGGADSVLLLCFLIEYRRRKKIDFTILPVHINHGIRGEEAKRDEDFCRNIAKMLDLPLEVAEYSVPEIAKAQRIGIEEAARNVRYSHFTDIKQGRNDITSIAVAHNMSDNAETVIINMLRGSGTRGGGGIRPVRDYIVRPLIKISKKQIIEALDSSNIPYVIDSTNLSTDYTRNYVRHEILPRLERIAENPEMMISRFSDNLRSDNEYIEQEALELVSSESNITNKKLRSLPYSVYVRVLSLMAEGSGCGISSKIASDIFNVLNRDNFTYSLVGGQFSCDRGICRVEKSGKGSDDFFHRIELGENHPSPEYDLIISTGNTKEIYSNIYKFSIHANLSSAIIDGDLYLRPKMDGDKIYYGGMTHKLKKLFNDRKIPLTERKTLPILCDNKGVLWVPGFGVRDDCIPEQERKDLFVVLGYLSDLQK